MEHDGRTEHHLTGFLAEKYHYPCQARHQISPRREGLGEAQDAVVYPLRLFQLVNQSFTISAEGAERIAFNGNHTAAILLRHLNDFR